jgi:hypothetical protein
LFFWCFSKKVLASHGQQDYGKQDKGFEAEMLGLRLFLWFFWGVAKKRTGQRFLPLPSPE